MFSGVYGDRKSSNGDAERRFEKASTNCNEAGNQHNEGTQQDRNPRQQAKGFVGGSAGTDIFLHMHELSKLRPKYPRRLQNRIMRSNSKRNNELALTNPGWEPARAEFVPKIKQRGVSAVLN
jgi:hypothetical protein